MKAKRNLLTAMIAVLFLSSCSNDEVFVGEYGVPNSKLTVRTRAGNDGLGDETSKISYPVNVYVFNETGKCVSLTALDEGESEISIALVEGKYNVYAVAGADAVAYDLPTQETATAQSPVSLKPGASHGDLMAAGNMVQLEDGGENTLTLGLSRKVMYVQNVEIGNVPTKMQSVKVSVMPLYESLCVDGSYVGEGAITEIELSQIAGTKNWTSSNGVYCLVPTTSSATITVSMTDKEGVSKSFSYTCADKFEANYKINITGTYTQEIGVNLSGTIVGDEWSGERDITFDFDDTSSSAADPGETDDDDQQPTPSDEEAPAVGTLYKGKYYVYKSEETEGGTVVTLVMMEEKTGLSFESGTLSSITNAVNSAIAEMTDASDGVAGWRLPTQEEFQYIYDNFSTIRDGLIDNGCDVNMAGFYFCEIEPNGIGGFSFNSTNNKNPLKQEQLSGETILRPVTTLVFKK